MSGEEGALRPRTGRGLWAAAVIALALAGGYALLFTGSGARVGEPLAGAHATATAVRAAAPPKAPPAPALVVHARVGPSSAWAPVAYVHGAPAAWVSQRGGVTLMRFDQSLIELHLHAGSSDGGETGWRYGDQISPSEIHHVVAAVNGGFKLTYSEVGFLAGGHVAVPLSAGLGSIVTYANGLTNIGAWERGVPSAHERVFSVLQNQMLLVDRGAAAADVSSCVISCWGATIEGRESVARSGLGITADGMLVWAAGEQLLPSQLAGALVRAGAVRAIELDINPYWVAGYLYVHHRGGPAAVPVVPGQHGIAGMLLSPDARDFLTFVAR